MLADPVSEAKTDPLPAGLTCHSLRRTCASILFALGEAPSYVIARCARSPNLTLAICGREPPRRRSRSV
jgi:hypothetical protein